MTKKECPSCAMETDENNKVCHICGYEFPGYSRGFRWTAILLILIFAYITFRWIRS